MSNIDSSTWFYPTLILIAGGLLIYFGIYKHLGFENNITGSLPILLTLIGLLFAVFQVVLNIKIQAKRNVSQLRHTEYKEVVKILNSITDLVNEHMMNEANLHGLFVSLTHRINEYISFININNDYLFPNIINSGIAIETLHEVEKIKICTNKYIKELEGQKGKTNNEEPDKIFNLTQSHVSKMNWYIEVREHIVKYNNLKFKFLKKLQSYF
jgi:hypothetical protein